MTKENDHVHRNVRPYLAWVLRRLRGGGSVGGELGGAAWPGLSGAKAGGVPRARVPGVVREVEVFDQYRGKGVEPGKKSLAFRIVMQDTDRTLTDSEVEAVVASVREQLLKQFKAQPRT